MQSIPSRSNFISSRRAALFAESSGSYKVCLKAARPEQVHFAGAADLDPTWRSALSVLAALHSRHANHTWPQDEYYDEWMQTTESDDFDVAEPP